MTALNREGRMSVLDITVIGFGSFIALTAIGLAVFLAAYRH